MESGTGKGEVGLDLRDALKEVAQYMVDNLASVLKNSCLDPKFLKTLFYFSVYFSIDESKTHIGLYEDPLKVVMWFSPCFCCGYAISFQ